LQSDFTDYEAEDSQCYHIGCVTKYNRVHSGMENVNQEKK